MQLAKSDIATILAKGTIGAIPIVGALGAEVIGALVPNRRLQRVEQLLEELAKKIDGKSAEDIEGRFRSPEFVDLLEESIIQASKALSDERVERIAALLKNGLNDDDLNHLRDKRMLELLGQFNDAELIILQSHTRECRHDPEWVKRHERVLALRPAYIGAPKADLDAAALHSQFNEHLAQIGLLEPRYRIDRQTGLPEFDAQRGTQKVTSYELSRLGRMLLQRIDLLGEDGL